MSLIASSTITAMRRSPTAGSVPGSVSCAPARRSTAPLSGSCHARSLPSADGSAASDASGRAALAVAVVVSTAAAAISASASPTLAPGTARAAPDITSSARIPNGRSAPEERGDRKGAPDPERGADHDPGVEVAEGEADPGQRPDAEAEHERREAEPEQHSVHRGGERHRQHAAPVLGELTADLRCDRAPRLDDGGGERDRRRGEVGDPAGVARDRPTRRAHRMSRLRPPRHRERTRRWPPPPSRDPRCARSGRSSRSSRTRTATTSR